MHQSEKTPIFQIFTILFWKHLYFHLNLFVIHKKAKANYRGIGSFSKFEKERLNRLYSRGRAAHGPIQNLSIASGISKKKVEQFLLTKTSYTMFGPPIRRFRELQAFSKYIN